VSEAVVAIERVNEAVKSWRDFADKAGVRKSIAARLAKQIKPL
jgi:hypothetical protein